MGSNDLPPYAPSPTYGKSDSLTPVRPAETPPAPGALPARPPRASHPSAARIRTSVDRSGWTSAPGSARGSGWTSARASVPGSARAPGPTSAWARHRRARRSRRRSPRRRFRPAAEGAGPAEAERLGEGEALPPFPSGAREESPPPACPACPSGSTCPPSGSAPVPRRSADELGAGFPPPPSSLTLIQPAEARTAREAAIQTAVRPGADNWRTGAPPVQGTRVSLPNSRHPARDTPGIPLTARAARRVTR